VLALVLVRSSPVLLVLGVVIAIMNYRNTSEFRRRTGVSPWGIHPVIWALSSLFISLLVTVLALIAMHTTKVKGAGVRASAGAGQRPVNERQSATPDVGGSDLPPAEWFPDPSGKFELRFWDGTRWTEYVLSDGTSSVDHPPMRPDVID
jgi:hypothetical protein